MLYTLDGDALGKLEAFASLFTLRGDSAHPIFELPTGSALFR